MGLPLYLAMTAAEIAGTESLPKRLAYMACHFSPYGTGLSNLPGALPEDSVLILNDRTPISGHDPERIAKQLEHMAEQFHCHGILLDLQRPDCRETAELCTYLAGALPCPVVISDLYAGALSCPVFLPPPASDTLLSRHIAPWQGREIWLEAALESVCITVTREGTTSAPIPYTSLPETAFRDQKLHCSYTTQVTADAIRFRLTRAPEDLSAFLEEAQTLGITHAVGLHQELGGYFSNE